MVGHQHIGMYRQAFPPCCLHQAFKAKEVVVFPGKNGFAIVTALDHMERLIRHKIARQTGHETSFSDQTDHQTTRVKHIIRV